MEAELAGIEREMGRMDIDHSDPRALAGMMRRISDLTGQPMPGQMDEIVRRMEAGEDPDKLEEEYGDALEGLGSDMDAGEAGMAHGAKMRARPSPPTRDPALYEMRDFLD
jgi:hypothetical protein